MRPRHSWYRRGLVAVVVSLPISLAVSIVAASSPPPPDAAGLPELAALEALGEAPDDCPFDLVGALAAVGLEPDGDVDVEVDHARPLPPLSTIPIDDLTSLDMAGGVVVGCSADVDGVEVEAWLHASPNERATLGTFIPMIAIYGETVGPQLQPVINRMTFTPVGGLVGLDDLVGGPIVVARPVVVGAADATLVVFADGADAGSDEGSSMPVEPAVDVEAVATLLIGAVEVAEDEFVEQVVDRYEIDAEQARCVYAALDGDVADVTNATVLDLSWEELERLTAALTGCGAPAATTSP